MRITSAPSCAMVMPPSGAARKAENSTMRRSANSRFIALRSGPENARMHDAPGKQGEQSGDHQRAEKQSAHRSPVPLDLMAPRQPHSQRQHQQSENRQEMDRAPRSPQPDLMDEERAYNHGQHQPRPRPAEQAVRDCAFGCRELNRAERECAECSEGV